jgi:hypothetical protein
VQPTPPKPPAQAIRFSKMKLAFSQTIAIGAGMDTEHKAMPAKGSNSHFA